MQQVPVTPTASATESMQESGAFSDPRFYQQYTTGFDRLSAASAQSLLQQFRIPYSEASFTERAAEGDMRGVRLFLIAGMPVDARDTNGDTALIKAVGEGRRASWGRNIEIIKTLIQAGADVNAVGGQKMTALRLATYMRQTEVTKVLQAAGAKQPGTVTVTQMKNNAVLVPQQ